MRDCRAKLIAASTWDAKSSAASDIRAVYGGMGSFNDWYVDGECERGDFDDIRTQLYDLSLSYQDARLLDFYADWANDMVSR